ncbi:hypothetical protein D3C75_1216370 [compost metagenome]
MAQGVPGGLLEDHFAVAALNGQRIVRRFGERLGAAQQQGDEEAGAEQGRQGHGWVIQVIRG